MSGYTRKDAIINTINRNKIGVAFIAEKMVESNLRWSGHVWRKLVEALIRRVDLMENILIVRGRRRKIIGRQIIKSDLEVSNLSLNQVHGKTL